MKYLVEYERNVASAFADKHYHAFTAKADATFRELQRAFDPNYHFNYLKFFSLGPEIRLIEGD